MKQISKWMFLCIFALCGCVRQAQSNPVTSTIFAMDTTIDFTIYGTEKDLSAAESCLMELESKLSVTDTGSEIYAVNKNGTGMLSQQISALLEQALTLCQQTEGALDLSIYPVVRAWGFTTGQYAVPDTKTLAGLLSHVDYHQILFDRAAGRVTLAEGMQIDLGSVAKGYAGDQVVSLLRQNGVTSALLNLGGNVQALGSKPDGTAWRIAIQNPLGDGYLGAVEINNQAVITSGGYERFFEQNGQIYWHIINPTDGMPANNGLVSVTIIGDNGLRCDGLSTALFVMGLEKAIDFWQEYHDFEAVFVSMDGGTAITEGLEDRFTYLLENTDTNPVTVIRQHRK